MTMFLVRKKPVMGRRIIAAENSSNTLRVRRVTGSILKRKRVEVATQRTLSAKRIMPSTSCTGVCLAITMLQYYICLGIVLTVILVLGLGLGFGIILYL